MVASIGVIASPSRGVSYYERDGYYAKDDPAHLETSAWAGKAAEALGSRVRSIPTRSRPCLKARCRTARILGKRGQDGEIHHRPGRDVTLSAPKSVSFMALVGGDERIVAAHDRAVGKTLAWVRRVKIDVLPQVASSNLIDGSSLLFEHGLPNGT